MIINGPHIEGAKKYIVDREFGKDLMRKIQIGPVLEFVSGDDD